MMGDAIATGVELGRHHDRQLDVAPVQVALLLEVEEETHDVLDRGGHVREHRHLVAELSVTGRVLFVDPGDVRRKVARGNKGYARHAILPSGCDLGYGRSLADKRPGRETIFGQTARRAIEQARSS